MSPEQVDYTVDEGSSGFLGIGTRDARISVAVLARPRTPLLSLLNPRR